MSYTVLRYESRPISVTTPTYIRLLLADEFDVFMDEVNRQISAKMLVRLAVTDRPLIHETDNHHWDSVCFITFPRWTLRDLVMASNTS
jgi:hypothetical protein